MAEFILMLTKHDVTIPNALAVYEEIRTTKLRWVGFKDVGASPAELKSLVTQMHSDDRRVVLEVVSLDEASEARSIITGVELGVDMIMGGTHPHIALPLLAHSGIRYFPFSGRIVGHPSVLAGTVDEIAANGAALTSIDGIHGLDLLAYRFDGDVPGLIKAVVDAAKGPVVAAGSIETADQIRLVSELGCWGFTIGGGILDRTLVPDGSLPDQIEAALTAATDRAQSASVA